LNPVNNITQMTDSAGAHNYTYDPLDRLTAATHPSQSNESYTYDAVGNRTASLQGSSYTYDPFNRLVAANGSSFGYDGNGNLVSKAGAGGNGAYAWDYENRLKQTTLVGGATVNYSYDALGRRIQRNTSSGSTTRFVYDGTDVVRDLDGNGATIADYLNAPSIDNKLRQTVGGFASYFLADHLRTMRALSDSSGSLSSTLIYDSFGNLASGPASTRYTYTGRELDADSGLIYYRARWYEPQQGRFISQDPIGFVGGTNFYAYVGNTVPNFRDPSGLERLQPYHLKGQAISPKNCQCEMEVLGHTAQFFAGFGDTISASVAGSNPIIALFAPGWSPTAWIRGFTPGAAAVDPTSNSYFAGQVGGVVWDLAFAVAGAAGPKSGPSGLGDLTSVEVRQIQRTVNQAGRPLEVVGSAARCSRTSASDIDYLVPHGSLPYYENFGLQRALPRIDSEGLIPGVHNPYIGPAIRFEPGMSPMYIPGGTK